MPHESGASELAGMAFRVGEWLVEPSLNRISRGATVIQLELKAMDVLVCLAENAGALVSRRQLTDTVWATEFITDNTVTHAVADLRTAFGDDPRQPRYIETIHRKGYRLIAPVEAAEPPAATVAPFPTHSAARDDRSPYPGLAAFTEEDAEFFFGREVEVERMWRKLTSRRLLAVIGPSGVGKSSFLRAGVIPARPAGWGALVCHPGDAPLAALARALVPEFRNDTEAITQLVGLRDGNEIVGVVTRWRARHEQILLVVDQFEELFTLAPAEEQQRFADVLRRLVDDADVHVLLVLRDDFLYQCQELEPLRPVFEGVLPLALPAAASRRRAVVEPARRMGYAVEDETLVDDMLAEVEHERGALPLLAFAAARLWETRDRTTRLLTRQAYREIGGVGGALARHAEATIDSIGHHRLPIVRELFRNLVTAEGTRAVREWDELLSVFEGSALPSVASKGLGVKDQHSSPLTSERSERLHPSPDRGGEAAEVLRELIDARLLTSYEVRENDREPTRRVEIIHESLLANWPRLVRWQTQDADAARLRDELRQAARIWHEHGRTDDLLWSGSAYRELALWRERYPGGLSELEEAFATAMASAALHRRRRRRATAAAVIVAAVAVAVVTTALWRQSELRARQVEAWRLSDLARRMMEQSPSKAFAHAVASLRILDEPEARRLALQALWRSPLPLIIPADPDRGSFVGVEFSPDARWLVTGHSGGHLALYSASGAEPAIWHPHDSGARGSFTPDSRALFSAALLDPELRVWSVPDVNLIGTRPRPVVRPDATQSSMPDPRESNNWRRLQRLVASPDVPGGWEYDERALEVLRHMPGERLPPSALSPNGGSLLYAAGRDLRLVSLEVPEGTERFIGRCPATVEHVTFSPDGKHAASLESDGVVRLWALGDSPAEVRNWKSGSEAACYDLRFDPTGRVLVAPLSDGTGLLWVVDEPPGLAAVVLNPAGGRMIEAAFSPDGRWLATANMIISALWPVDPAHLPRILRGHSGLVERLAFSPDGSWLASISTDGTIRRWPLEAVPGAAPEVLYDWGHPIESHVPWMQMGPDGRALLAGGGERSVRVVPIDGSPPRSLGQSDDRIWRGAISRQGNLVAMPATVNDTPMIQVWDLETGQEVTEIAGLKTIGQTLSFAPDGRLLVVKGRTLLAVDLATGERSALMDDVGYELAVGPRARHILSRPAVDGPGPLTLHDLDAGTSMPLVSHGSQVYGFALDPTGSLAVTGSTDGVVRVGPISGEEPVWMVGDTPIISVAVSPDGRTIATGGLDGSIRLWSMPDLSLPRLHQLPRQELLAKFDELTNVRSEPDPENPGNYRVTVVPFPGWAEAPEW
jgi:WD40 repeat protein/DNA-binding winged helix-turn-helix (wHTH) protein